MAICHALHYIEPGIFPSTDQSDAFHPQLRLDVPLEKSKKRLPTPITKIAVLLLVGCPANHDCVTGKNKKVFFGPICMSLLPLRRASQRLLEFSFFTTRQLPTTVKLFYRTMATIQTSPEREILPTNVIPRHYRLSLTPDFSTFKFAGKVSVALDVAKPTSSIILNALELEFHSATVDNSGKSISSKSISVDDEMQVATIEFGEELKVGKDNTTLNIDFTGILNDKMAGFYRSSYIDAKTGEKKWLATTQMGTSLRRISLI
jgi:Peptidase M1 N-terminal domain